jgi:hypothetical protein
MRMRYEFVFLIVLTMTTSTRAVAQKLTEDSVPPKKPATLRLPKTLWLSLSAATYTAAALDMHATADAVERKRKYPLAYLGFPESDPIAKPFVKLPRPAYYACGFALATGINWLGY